MKILVTGAYGFLGRNLVAQLQQNSSHQLLLVGREDDWDSIAAKLSEAEFIFHFAGVNRPQSEEEFYTGNTLLTEQICNHLLALKHSTSLLFTSSTQAALDNPYGLSKLKSEDAVRNYAHLSGAKAWIYRLPGIFGKWSRPNYNSVVATFCHNIARDLPIKISSPDRVLELVYVDDVICHFLQNLEHATQDDDKRISSTYGIENIAPIYKVTLEELACQIHKFHESRQTLLAPNFANVFTHKLYATYLSYLEPNNFGYQLEKRSDLRGSLAEFIKLPAFGQIFVSRTAPGITRGNHYHHTKTEKFLVLEGKAMIRLRALQSSDVIEYFVDGCEYKVIDIPPGYTHSIENVGKTELVTLFWASELFDPQHPDTHFVPVIKTEE